MQLIPVISFLTTFWSNTHSLKCFFLYMALLTTLLMKLIFNPQRRQYYLKIMPKVSLPARAFSLKNTIEFFVNKCQSIKQIQWVMIKSKDRKVTASITYLNIVTYTVVIVVENTFSSLLPLGRYCPLTTLSSYIVFKFPFIPLHLRI